MKKIFQITCIIMLVFFSYVFFMTLSDISHMDFLADYITGYRIPIFIISGVLALTGLIFLLLKITERMSGRIKILCCFAGAAGAVAIQLFLILFFRPIFRYDALSVFDTAMAVLKGNHITNDTLDGYFAENMHNISPCIFYVKLLQAGIVFGLKERDYSLYLQIINCIGFDLSIAFCFLTIKKWVSNHAAGVFLVVSLFNPLFYLYPTFCYTRISSIFFMAGLFYSLISLYHALAEGKTKKGLIFSALSALFLVVGMKIRILILIIPIAGLAGLFLWKKMGLLLRKKTWIQAGMFAAVFICASGIYSQWEQKYSEVSKEESYPLEHWVMMGLSENGTYNAEDFDITGNAGNYQERRNTDIAIIKERLKNAGVSGIIKLFGRKLTITWSDGYDDMDYFEVCENYCWLNDFLNGSRQDILVGYMHIYNSICWLFMILGIVFLLKRREVIGYGAAIIVFGAMLFHLIWEAGEAYSSSYSIFYVMCAALAIGQCYRLAKRVDRYITIPAAVYELVYIIVLCLCFFKPLKQTIMDNRSYVAVQDLPESFGSAIMGRGDKIEQTFTTDRTFNRIGIGFAEYEGQIDNSFVLRLRDDSNSILYEKVLTEDELQYFCILALPDVTPERRETYCIEIDGTNAAKDSYLTFSMYNTGNLDIYPEGKMWFDDRELGKADLSFLVYCKTKRYFFS